MAKEYEIRPYQEAAKEACLAGLKEVGPAHVPRGILCLPTGAGKTHVFSQIILEYIKTGEQTTIMQPLQQAAELHDSTENTERDRVLVIVHRKELIEQVQHKLLENNIIAEIEQSKQRARLDAPVVIASVQSLQGKRLARYQCDHFALIVIDECHHTPAKSYKNVIAHFDTVPILGVTATVDRLDKKSLKAIYHSGIWYNYPMLEAILSGYIMEPKPVICNIVCDLRQCRTVSGDYVQADTGAVIYKHVRSIATALVKETRDLLTLSFTPTVESAVALAAHVRELGINACAVWGTSPDRDEILEQFKQGIVRQLVNCEIFTEGVDVPQIEAIGLCRPTKSRSKYCQMIGRGGRPYGSKTYLKVIDFQWLTTKHDLLIDPIKLLAEHEPGLVKARLTNTGNPVEDIMRARKVVEAERIAREYARREIDLLAERQATENRLREVPRCARVVPPPPHLRPTAKQQTALRNCGVIGWQCMDFMEARNALRTVSSRIDSGKCHYARARAISILGLMSEEQALEITDTMAKSLLGRNWYSITSQVIEELAGPSSWRGTVCSSIA